MAKQKKPVRRFVKERRTISCPACLDRDEKYDFQPLVDEVYKPLKSIFGSSFLEEAAVCEVCDGRRQVEEINIVGFEWRRYPWVIVK